MYIFEVSIMLKTFFTAETQRHREKHLKPKPVFREKARNYNKI